VFAPRSGRFLGVGLLGVLALSAWAVFPGTLPRIPLLLASMAAAIVWIFFAEFFRDPERPVGVGIVSAADGRVQSVEAEGDRVRVAVFMNVTDVHVNRFPLDARVASIQIAGEGFRPAYSSDAHHNRRCHYQLETSIGPVEVVQMTGIVARRLVPFVRTGQSGRRGDRLGMIVLGSRVDVLLPSARVELRVHPRDRVVAGVTTLAVERP
jgi:phosphatidylserine decarboxylase